MKQNTKRTIVIIAIILAALLLGVLADLGWSAVETHEHPLTYIESVEKYAAQYNIPKEIIFAVIKTESGFDASAVSSAGAMGLMQMMPSTFEWLTGAEHLNEGLAVSSLTDPEISIRYGTYYLSYLREQFKKEPSPTDVIPVDNTDWDIVFAAYNAGEGNVTKWLSDPTCISATGELIHIPFPETRSYVSKVNDAVSAYKKLYPEAFK